MWESGVLGYSMPEVLQNTVWFLLTLHNNGMRGRDEHYGDFNVNSTDDKYRYVEFNEHDTKTRTVKLVLLGHSSPKCGIHL